MVCSAIARKCFHSGAGLSPTSKKEEVWVKVALSIDTVLLTAGTISGGAALCAVVGGPVGLGVGIPMIVLGAVQIPFLCYFGCSLPGADENGPLGGPGGEVYIKDGYYVQTVTRNEEEIVRAWREDDQYRNIYKVGEDGYYMTTYRWRFKADATDCSIENIEFKEGYEPPQEKTVGVPTNEMRQLHWHWRNKQ